MPVAYEARCKRCGETFNPDSWWDLHHYVKADDEPCGGEGEMLGSWR